MANGSRITNTLLGGWTVSWGAVLQGGQPITLSCPSGTGNGYRMLRHPDPGARSTERDAHRLQRTAQLPRESERHSPSLACGGQPDPTPLRFRDAFRLMAASACWVDPRPRLPDHRSSGWISPPSKTSSSPNASTLQFRAEFFNILNHPNFNAPNFGGNGVNRISGSGNFTSSNFGEVGSTRDAPYDPRQIQFALKLWF